MYLDPIDQSELLSDFELPDELKEYYKEFLKEEKNNDSKR